MSNKNKALNSEHKIEWRKCVLRESSTLWNRDIENFLPGQHPVALYP